MGSFRQLTTSICVSASLYFSTNAQAIFITPTAIQVFSPAGSNDTTNPYQDDVLLESITFGSVTYSSNSGQLVAVQSAYVSVNAGDVNAEFGDLDTDVLGGSDGNPNPFTRVGVDVSLQETTDPTIQNTTIASAFSTNSLIEGTDGENSAGFTFSLTFAAGIIDNDVGVDSVPELVIFERGNNDTTTIRAIVGGTYDNPTYAANTLTINPGELWNTGVSIDTSEIGAPQELGAIGIDVSDFGATTIYGIEITSNGGDFYGQFLSADDPGSQIDPNVPTGLLNPQGTVPEPSSWALLLGALAACNVSLSRKPRTVA